MIDFVYITSASHSGSTLLTLLLARHPAVTTIGETIAVQSRGNGDTGLCSCGELISECGFWKELERRLKQRRGVAQLSEYQTDFRLPQHRWTDRLLRAEYHGRCLEMIRDTLLAASPAWRSHGPRLLANNEALIDEVVRLSGKPVFVDSSKEPHRLKFLLQIPSLRTRAIHLVRDGRGVMASYMRRAKWPPERAVDEWRRSILSEEHILRRLPADARIFLHYEDLCRDVESHVARLLQFMGLDPQAWVRDQQGLEHHILGNRMRMQKDWKIQLDEKWRETLTRRELEIFERIGGRLNRKYGYTALT